MNGIWTWSCSVLLPGAKATQLHPRRPPTVRWNANAWWYPLDARCQGSWWTLSLFRVAVTMLSSPPVGMFLRRSLACRTVLLPSTLFFYYPLNIWKIYTLIYKTWSQKEECVSECCMQIGMGVHQHIVTMGAATRDASSSAGHNPSHHFLPYLCSVHLSSSTKTWSGRCIGRIN